MLDGAPQTDLGVRRRGKSGVANGPGFGWTTICGFVNACTDDLCVVMARPEPANGGAVDTTDYARSEAVFVTFINRQTARRRTTQTVAAMSSTDSASSQPPSIHWNGQNRLTG